MDQYQTTQMLTDANVQQTSDDISMVVILVSVGVWFILSIIMGFVAASIASYNERRQTHAFFAGFFFGPLGVVAYMIMGESVELRVELEQKALKKLK